MNLPNILTIFRIFLTVIFIVLFNRIDLPSTILALIVFTLAALTDFLDGYLARKYQLTSTFGKIMDPIADKFLVLSAFFIFAQLHLIALWVFIVIFIREVTITGLRLFAMRKGVALAAEEAGKLKTVLQIVLVYLIMVLAILIQVDSDAQWIQVTASNLFKGINVFVSIVIIITLWSGFTFVRNNCKEIFHVG